MKRWLSNKVALWVDISVLANCLYPVFALHSVITHKTTMWMLFKYYFHQQSVLSIKTVSFNIQNKGQITLTHTHTNHRLSTDKNKAISPSSTLLQTTFFKKVPFLSTGSSQDNLIQKYSVILSDDYHAAIPITCGRFAKWTAVTWKMSQQELIGCHIDKDFTAVCEPSDLEWRQLVGKQKLQPRSNYVTFVTCVFTRFHYHFTIQNWRGSKSLT
jgi:hypothetical protein